MREELHLLGERIAEQAVYLDAATYRLLADLQSFDAARGWAAQGFASCAHWLSWRVGWDRGTAADRLRVANKLPSLPKVAAKLEAGELSYSKARAIARVATPATEEVLLIYAEHLPAAQLERVCAKVKIVEDGKQALLAKAQGLPPPPPPERTVQLRGLDDGMVSVRAVLRAEEAALLIEVIQRAAKQGTEPPREDVAPRCDEEGAACSCDSAADPARAANAAPARATYDPRELPRTRADGLMTVIQAYARGASPERTPVELIVTVPAAVLASVPATAALEAPASVAVQSPLSAPATTELPSGDALSAESTRRLACDAGLVEVLVEGSTAANPQPLSVGRKTRTIPAAIKRALLARDRTCRFPGCSHRLYLDGHHIRHWVDGGETEIGNLMLLCSTHHSYVHEHGYRATQDGHGAFAFFDPRGNPVVAVPPRPRPTAQPGPLASTPSAESSRCRWRGERLDLPDAVGRICRISSMAMATASATTSPAADPTLNSR
jgi:Domain of unknown function (DUF222)/HNH endonuclease